MIGQPIPRLEDDRLLRGKGRFTDDLHREGQAWCAEGGIVPATAAVINAVCDALDVDEVAMPATPAKLWKVLQAKA